MMQSTLLPVAAAALSLCTACTDTGEEKSFEWKSPSEESLLQCVAGRLPAEGLTPLTSGDIRSAIIGQRIGFYPEGKSAEDVSQKDIVQRDGVYINFVDNGSIMSRYKVRGHCLCIGAGTYECLAFFRKPDGQIVTGIEGYKPFYLTREPID